MSEPNETAMRRVGSMSDRLAGEVTACTWDGDSGSAVILSSWWSERAHEAEFTLNAAQNVLAAALIDDFGYDDEHLPQMTREALDYVTGKAVVVTWRTVLAGQCEDGMHADCYGDGCEQGQMCTEGYGKRWMNVLCVGRSGLHGRWYDEMDNQANGNGAGGEERV